jgi:hypothetical protein
MMLSVLLRLIDQTLPVTLSKMFEDHFAFEVTAAVGIKGAGTPPLHNLKASISAHRPLRHSIRRARLFRNGNPAFLPDVISELTKSINAEYCLFETLNRLL